MSVTITDLFCGAGGSSLGAELAGATLRLGLNHWDRAIETHSANFQHADHDCEDISSLTTARIRRYPDSDILLASPECTNHSLAKGGRRRKPQAGSLFEDGPAGDAEQDRSRATMWDVVRFAEQKRLKGKPYKAIVVENVVDAFKWGYEDDGGLFSAWLQALRALGYEHEIVWLNSMLAGWVPQSRNRMYVVLWLKSMRRPNLRVEPVSWCPECRAVVHGRQTWKKPSGRLWGSYGDQYFYTCLSGHTCIPGAPPAVTAIDWSLPITRIGEQKPKLCRQCGKRHPIACSTRGRVRRGLIRTAAEPFAIRLLHNGAPRTLTLPLVTLTRRHDMAMVMPVSANTHERTAGNRMDNAQVVPLRAVHRTLDRALVVPPGGSWQSEASDGAEPMSTFTRTESRALVVPPMGDAEARSALEPGPTQTTTTRPALVMRNNESRGDAGQMCTPVDEPIRPLTTGGHQSVVVPMDKHTVPAVAAREPTSTIVAGGGKLALVVPYNSSGEAQPAEEEPLPTLTTRDRAAVVVSDEEIEACGLRMFALHEIAAGMAMQTHTDGGDYVVFGNKRECMAQYGGAVTPPVTRLIVGRLLEVLG